MAAPPGRIVVFALPVILMVNACLGGTRHQGDTTDFRLVKNTNGIDIYERWYPVTGGNRAREIKAVFVVEAAPSAVMALIRDESRGREWNSRTKTYEVVSMSDYWICHIEYEFPWPLCNQDCVLQYSAKSSLRYLEIHFNAVEHPSFPVLNTVQRISDIKGKWLLRKTADGTSIEYFITTKPSEMFPAWLTDPVIRGNLVATLRSMKEILESGYN